LVSIISEKLGVLKVTAGIVCTYNLFSSKTYWDKRTKEPVGNR
jgi:hypothetical protein